MDALSAAVAQLPNVSEVWNGRAAETVWGQAVEQIIEAARTMPSDPVRSQMQGILATAPVPAARAGLMMARYNLQRAMIAICLLVAQDVLAQTLPTDLTAALKDNVDHIQFKDFKIARTGQGKEGPYVCGKMNALFQGAIPPRFEMVDFVATFYSAPSWPRSWVTLNHPLLSDLDRQRYDQFCKQLGTDARAPQQATQSPSVSGDSHTGARTPQEPTPPPATPFPPHPAPHARSRVLP